METTLERIQSALTDGLADDTAVLATERQSGGLFTHMVLVTAGSARHAAALTTRTCKALKAAGDGNPSVESSPERDWTLIDCGDILVHIFQKEARGRYCLEELWGFERTPES